MGLSPFFNFGNPGAEVDPRILASAPNAPIVTKEFAVSFVDTNRADTLSKLGVTELFVCGTMTQNQLRCRRKARRSIDVRSGRERHAAAAGAGVDRQCLLPAAE
jgi:hypothetical protein